MAESTEATPEGFEVEPIEAEARQWLGAVEAETGPIALYDTHTHFGRHDPDEFRQEPEQLIATMEFAGARAITFPMHEPDGYPPANDEARGIETGAGAGHARLNIGTSPALVEEAVKRIGKAVGRG